MAPRPVDVTIRGKNETKPAFDAAEKTAESFAGRMKNTLVRPFELFKGFVALQAIRVVGDFAKASVESAASAAAAWGRVESAVTNLGINFGGVRGELDHLFTAIQKTTRYSDDDAATAFANLLTISQNYAGSVSALSVVTNLAAAKQMDLRTASDLVGRAMIGDTSTLKRYGIVVQAGTDAVEAMRTQLRGFAERDAKTLQGQLAQIANAWDNVKEAIGRALTGESSAPGMTAFADALNQLGAWIDDNQANVHDFATELGHIVAFLVKLTTLKVPGFGRNLFYGSDPYFRQGPKMPESLRRDVDAAVATGAVHDRQPPAETAAEIAANAKKAADAKAAAEAAAAKKAADAHVTALTKEADLLVKKRQLLGATITDMERLNALSVELAKVAGDATQPLERRLTAADAAASLRPYSLEGITAGGLQSLASPGTVQQTPTTSNVLQPVPYAKIPAVPIVTSATSGTFRRGVGDAFADAAGVTDPLIQSTKDLGDALKDLTGGAVANLFDTWRQGIIDIVQLHEHLGTAIVATMRRAAGGALAADAQDTLLRAAKALALSLTDPSGLHLAQAGRLFLVGSAETAAAAALSGGGGGGSGYGGGGGGGGLSTESFQQSRSDASQGKTTVVLKGSRVDFRNAEDLQGLLDMLRELGVSRDLEFVFAGGE